MSGVESNGAGEAFGKLYRETVEPLWRFVARRAGSRDFAEDVTQEVYLRAVAHFGRKGWPTEPLAWLQAVARNLLASHYRRAPIARGADVETLLAREREDSRDSTDRLSAGLARLREDQARLLEEFHVEGRSVREIAASQGRSERAVEGRLARARAKLKSILERERRP